MAKITARTQMCVHLTAEELTEVAMERLVEKYPEANLGDKGNVYFVPKWSGPPRKGQKRAFLGLDVVIPMEDEEVK